ncbi:MAG: carbamoyltransferase HypF [Thermoplasmata archaeon]|nr:carbamoyltransferase HypF [Thermoplasmata archaeon]
MRFTVTGTVQGVGFRPTVYRLATELGLKGTVRNNGANVVIDVDADAGFMDLLETRLPALAHIESCDIEDIPISKGLNGFSIIESDDGGHGIGIPTDTAICPSCLAEMRGNGRRAGYAFTTCTECGARFTLMESMPYDRQRTSMGDYPMCEHCSKEYSDPTDRRFHHQTVCCPHCGPSYRLVDSDGNPMDGDPIRRFAELLDMGKIGVAKSWGGMHICATIDRIQELRDWYGRKQKPFAIMAKDADTIMKYSDPTDEEMEQILSPHRPIVLVRKKDTMPEASSPGLDTVGMFLPYSGMQYLLFDYLKSDAAVMTSANVPGEPMILNDEGIFELNADMYLLHNQRIVNRADDSVMKLYGKNTYFLRKSRGHIPSYLDLGLKGDAVAVGPQENLTASVATNGRIFTTQHIGNGESFGVVDYLKDATDSLIKMTGCEPQIVAMDLHPGYANRKYAKSLAERTCSKTIEVQHHWAHCASLMVDSEHDEMVCLTLDGTGHGDDGNAWGGEVMFADLNKYDRLAHLQYIPLLGGDKALYDIRRLKFAIDSINGSETPYVDDRTADVFSKMMSRSVRTSSFGRLLDALAYSLDVCTERTYDGEPAMKMEPLLRKGKVIEGFDTEIVNGEIRTAHLFTAIDGLKKEDVAISVVDSVISKMVETACDSASKKGIREIGITGGVSYSIPISDIFRRHVELLGFTPIFHNRVPNGDGGISVGQSAIALNVIQ